MHVCDCSTLSSKSNVNISNMASNIPQGAQPPNSSIQFGFIDGAQVDNPQPQMNKPPPFSLAGTNGDRVVIVLVGLPATGKTYIARRLRQYLSFFHGAPTEVFNVAEYRLKLFGVKPNTFFSDDNQEAVKARAEAATAAMNDLKAWLDSGSERGRVAIYDATNTTRQRRQWVIDQLRGCTGSATGSERHVVFVESVYRDEKLAAEMIDRAKLKMPDYEGKDAEEALKDFDARIRHVKSTYEPLCEDEDQSKTWIRIMDGGRCISMNNIAGFLQGRIVQFLMNLHNTPRSIYLSRHGESQYNKLGKIGGDSSLSERGERYALKLAEFVHEELLGLEADGSFKSDGPKLVPHVRLYTSSLRRTRETARHIVHPTCDDGWVAMRPRVWRALDEIYAGVFDGMTYEEIKAQAPHEHAARSQDKLSYRYPRGESYLDVIQRLDPIIHEVERQTDGLLIVGHQGILRIIYAYLMGMKRDEAPHVSIPLNTVIKLTPGTYECEEQRLKLVSDNENDEPPSH